MIPQHGHCQMCGKAVKYGETVCSEKCQEDYVKYIKKRKLYVYIMYAALAVLIAMFVLSYSGS